MRKEAGLTLKMLADKTGLSVSFLSKIENGQIIPSLPRLKIIADALRIDLEYFIRPKAVVGSLEHVIGARLRKRKDEVGVSLSMLADQTGLSRAFLSSLINGKVLPSLRTLEVMAATLKVDLSYFFQYEGEKYYVVSRKGKREVRSFPKDSGVPSYDVELLAEGFENQVMEPAITTLIGEEKRMNLQSHAGQECWKVRPRLSLGRHMLCCTEEMLSILIPGCHISG
ncbi:MAG: helix-turn-helix domain-containing protein [Deltaproteobacteria bacterium]|nr:helix-turn-helix domain-containing protein [Deltaproteobacteria bacterium]